MQSDIQKKKWSVRTLNDKTNIDFFPEFIVKNPEGESSMGIPTATDKDVECRYVHMTIGDKTYIFNFLDLFMFIYFCANEELRQQLMLRYERQVTYLPYDVSFKLDAEEMKSGQAKRRIELPVDEITMALTRDEAKKLAIKGRVYQGNK